MNKLKHILYVLVFFLVISSIKPILAQAPTITTPTTTTAPTTNSQILYGNVNSQAPQNLNTLTQSAIINTLSSTVCILSGYNPLDPKKTCLGVDVNSGQIGYETQGGGATQIMGRLIGETFMLPVSGVDYATYMAGNFGVARSAYAQNNPEETGVGFDRLRPLLGIWARFRDISYLAFVLAFTIVGLAIMFRVKIDARTVMSIQNQIPKLIVALILVTFSYAIAGLLIDLMYVSLYLVILTFNSLIPTNVNTSSTVFGVVNKSFSIDTPNVIGITHIPGIIGIAGQTSFGVSKVLGNMSIDFLESTISSFFQVFFTPFNAVSSIGCGVVDLGKVGATVGLGALGWVPGLGGWLRDTPIGGMFAGGGCNFVESFFRAAIISLFTIVTFLIILIAIIFSLFRVWFTLIKSFIYVLIDVIVAPLWITAGIFPGSKLGFSTWIRHLMGHLSVFPMAFGVILLGKTIMSNVGNQGGLFSPPLIGDAVGGSPALAAFIGFGFIISMPSILDRTRKAVGAMDFGLKDIRTSFGASQAVGGKGISGVKEMAFGAKAEYGKDGQLHAAEAGKKFLRGMFGR
ncbi:MAG: hypothetical protein KBC00_00750 [Candidatus Levybacteria bacterium]|nr:hypothetical protein [Candidatus Levybacteria bacterium]MBP9814723.1 hypothetical protein [Candidatus Levybacteria bacterium]